MKITVQNNTINNTDKRKLTYPSIEEQLDMLWHAIDTDSLDKTCDFYLKLKEVKDGYPTT